MEVKQNIAWVFYINEPTGFNDKVGKWMCFFNPDNVEFIEGICKKAIEENVVKECKHTNPISVGLNPFGGANTAVACFYINGDDNDAHKRVLKFFIDNNLIRRTKTGKLYNISFKYDSQTHDGQYGAEFESNIKLANFVDPETGEFI